MKGIIVYKSKYGATAQYAAWLGDRLQLPAVKAENIKASQFSSLDFMILGGSVYIGEFQLKDWLRENLDTLRGKSLFLFIVCGTPSDQQETLQKIARNNIPAEIRDRSKIYFLPGRVIRKNLSWTDRLLLRAGSILTKDASAKRRMLNDYDQVNAASLNPLISAVNDKREGRRDRIAANPSLL